MSKKIYKKNEIEEIEKSFDEAIEPIVNEEIIVEDMLIEEQLQNEEILGATIEPITSEPIVIKLAQVITTKSLNKEELRYYQRTGKFLK